MLRKRLFPRLIRETRRHRGVSSRARPTQREMELLMGLHGGLYYVSMRRWIYGQGVYTEDAPMVYEELMVRDRVRGYLLASSELFGGTAGRRWRRWRRQSARSEEEPNPPVMRPGPDDHESAPPRKRRRIPSAAARQPLLNDE